MRPGARGGIRLLPGQGHRHGARPGHPDAGLVSLRGLRARPRAARRRARRRRGGHVAGPGRDERPRRRRGPVQGGRRAAGGPGRGPADRQARRAGGRGQRRRPGRRRAGARPAHRRQETGAAAALAAAGQALRGHRRHRRPHDLQGDGRAGREGRGRPRPHPRGQARRLLHPGQAGQGRLPGPRPGLLQRHRHLRARRRLRRAS